MFYQQLVDIYTFDNISLLVASVLTFGFGFWEYIYSFRLTIREGSAPFPIWMHTFYFAHDTTWAFLLLCEAPKYDWNWFLTGAGIALIVWGLFEVFNMYKALTVERVEIWGPYYGKDVTIKQAAINMVVQIVAFYCIMQVFIAYVGPGCFFQTAMVTNMVMASLPGLLWRKRGSRKGSGMGIALVILGGTINTFWPIGMFVVGLPEVFDHPWFYITGIVFTLIALSNLIYIARLPKKEQLPGEKRPIW